MADFKVMLSHVILNLCAFNYFSLNTAASVVLMFTDDSILNFGLDFGFLVLKVRNFAIYAIRKGLSQGKVLRKYFSSCERTLIL